MTKGWALNWRERALARIEKRMVTENGDLGKVDAPVGRSPGVFIDKRLLELKCALRVISAWAARGNRIMCRTTSGTQSTLENSIGCRAFAYLSKLGSNP